MASLESTATAVAIAESLNLLQHLAIFCAGDQQAVVRGSIDDVNQVALDEQAPRRAEIGPLIQKFAFLVENLDAVVRAIGHVDAAL